MIIPLNPLTMLFYLLTLAIDISLFFLLVRFLWLWRPAKGLAGFNRAGEVLVNQITRTTETLTSKFITHDLSEKGKLAISLTLLSLANLLLKGFLQ